MTTTKTTSAVTRTVPRYEELITMNQNLERENDFAVLLNQEPPKQWVQINKMANNSLYLPIDKIEYLLTRIFIRWWVEVLDHRVIANSVSVHVRLFYVSPVTGETCHQDGLGAAPMQTDKGAGATDWNAIKNSAVQMALPAAETYAIKDAAEKIGRIFGKDLNRKDLMNYTDLAGRMNVELSRLNAIKLAVSDIDNTRELNKLFKTLEKDEQKNAQIVEVFATKKHQIDATVNA